MLLITAKTGNEAMRDEYEVARMLRKVARDLSDNFQQMGTLVDANGNIVGQWEYTLD